MIRQEAHAVALWLLAIYLSCAVGAAVLTLCISRCADGLCHWRSFGRSRLLSRALRSFSVAVADGNWDEAERFARRVATLEEGVRPGGEHRRRRR